jgi:GNAT superfamily N-acetyltransferase
MITKPTPTELAKFARHMQRTNTDSIGFLTDEALREYGNRGNIIPAIENDQLVSFCLFFDGPAGKRPRNDPNDLRIFQMCTDYDARRLKHATRLLNKVIDFGHANGYHRIRLWCAQDLAANDFWSTCGFTKVGERLGGNRRNRYHNLWHLPIVDFPSPSAAIDAATFLHIPGRKLTQTKTQHIKFGTLRNPQ